MRLNKAGLDLIKQHEGCRLDAYLCPAGVWTIGYGHTGDVSPGQRITQHQADVLLTYDVESVEEDLREVLNGLQVSANQWAALVSFAFNLGAAALKDSTLLRRLKAGEVDGAAEEFRKWIYAMDPASGIKIRLAGLITRRADERALFLTPDPGVEVSRPAVDPPRMPTFRPSLPPRVLCTEPPPITPLVPRKESSWRSGLNWFLSFFR